MLFSYALGQHYYPVDYDLPRLGLYTLLTGVLYAAEWAIAQALPDAPILRMVANTPLATYFRRIIYRYEVPKGALVALRKKLLKR